MSTNIRYFQVRNWSDYQHYKDRCPPWIKLYNELLDDFNYLALDDASRSHLIAIWMLASRTSNKIPYDVDLLSRKLCTTEKVNLDALLSHEFIEIIDTKQGVNGTAIKMLADCTQDAIPERETEAYSKEDIDILFERFWSAYPSRKGQNPKKPAKQKFSKIIKHTDPEVLISSAKQYAESEKENIGTPFIAQAQTWLNQERWDNQEATVVTDEQWTKRLNYMNGNGGWNEEAGKLTDAPQHIQKQWESMQ